MEGQQAGRQTPCPGCPQEFRGAKRGLPDSQGVLKTSWTAIGNISNSAEPYVENLGVPVYVGGHADGRMAQYLLVLSRYGL